MGSPIADEWLHALVLLENGQGGNGTGFLVGRQTEGTAGRLFVVTNKHVVHDDPQQRRLAEFLVLHHNVQDSQGGVRGTTTPVPLRFDDDFHWREHPHQDVDVLAVEVTHLLHNDPKPYAKWIMYNLFLDDTKRREFEITIGDEVLVLGYPLGLKHAETNYPLVRDGIVATRIGELLVDEVPDQGKLRRRELRGFLIDGAVIPGSSGSPVILKPAAARFMRGGYQIGQTPPPILLGVVAETRYAPVRTPEGAIPSFAGLGLAFDAQTVKETIEQFFV